MDHEDILDLIHLPGLMQRTQGLPAVHIGIVDGPIAAGHPDLASPIRSLREPTCQRPGSPACAHGTFVAGILGAHRGSGAPGLCPGCPLLVRPVFLEAGGEPHEPHTTVTELVTALGEVISAGARIVNLSLALTRGSAQQDRELGEVLDWAALKGALVIAAAGNRGRVSSTSLTRHPWVLPVVSCNADGHPSAFADLSSSAARRGVMAPGEKLSSLDSDGGTRVSSGTSFAAALVTGAAGLLWSLFPEARADEIKMALLDAGSPRRSVVPPLLDAERAYRRLVRSAG